MVHVYHNSVGFLIGSGIAFVWLLFYTFILFYNCCAHGSHMITVGQCNFGNFIALFIATAPALLELDYPSTG